MPTYTYRCDLCGTESKTKHKMKEDPDYYCHSCPSLPQLRRVIESPRDKVLLKGKGWDSRPDFNCH